MITQEKVGLQSNHCHLVIKLSARGAVIKLMVAANVLSDAVVSTEPIWLGLQGDA